MEPSNVLVALEELAKWRARKGRLERKLSDLQERRGALRADLEDVSRELADIDDALFETPESSMDVQAMPPFEQGK